MNNLIIEGENLEALSYLKGILSNQIDLIIIDPPYNTNISYIEYADQNFEISWTDFMSHRLNLAFSLLSSVGVIFIHIDENELINLTNLCYSIFGVNNVQILVWKKTDPNFDKNRIEKPLKNIRVIHEFVLLCYKNKENTEFNPMKTDSGIFLPLESILDNLGTTSSAKDELEELFGRRNCFSTPKPMRLFKELIRAASSPHSIVLDFFAGSGTTGHAVMDLNLEEGSNRKYILVTNSENDICQKILIPRIKKVIELNSYNASFDYLKLE
jgi:Adenine specific DNA methylase Mod